MTTPDLNRIIETFIPIPIDSQKNPIAVWQDYADLLRTTVAQIIRERREQNQIRWYSFLVHNQQSGVPTTPNDARLFVHLRMELASGVDEGVFIAKLPPTCLMAGKMQVPTPPSLDTIDITFLKNSNVSEGWKILGESSEWVLSMLDSHDTHTKVPPQNVAQFLHYIGNQLFVRTIGIPMP